MREYPYPPRMMTRSRAAHYVDLAEAAFEREVAAGTLPGPATTLGGKPHWSRKDLDECLDRLSGAVQDDWRAKSTFYGRKRHAA